MDRVIFIDRDGVINFHPGDYKYVTRREDFKFLPRAKEALAMLYKSGYKIFIVSNQAGVSKGLYSEKDLEAITDVLLEGVNSAGGRIEDVFYCTHTDAENCSCRKPKTGLIEKALARVKTDIARTFFIGDSIRDVKTGRAAGCKTILVLSGKESLENKDRWEEQPDYVVGDLFEAAQLVMHKDRESK